MVKCKSRAIFAVLLFSVTIVSQAIAQDGGRDTTFTRFTFSGNPAVNDAVNTLVVLPDDTLLIGGWFTNINGAPTFSSPGSPRYRIARLLKNGGLDTTFNPGLGANSSIMSLAVQPDGKILAAGWFTAFGGVPIPRICRMDYDGQRDFSFDPGTNCDGNIYAMALQSDNKIVIGGNFTNFNGYVRRQIARLNADGAVDATFNVGTGPTRSPFSATIYALHVLDNQQILAAGLFDGFAGNARAGLVRLNTDGSLDTNFATVPFTNNSPPSVNRILVQQNGKIVINGQFTVKGTVLRTNLVRLNSDGTIDTTFTPTNVTAPTAIGETATAKLVTAQPTSIGGSSYSVVRYADDGSVDPTFSCTLPSLQGSMSLSPNVSALQCQSSGKLIVAGDFRPFGGINPYTNVIRLTSSPPALALPVITMQPPNRTVSVGQDTALLVWAKGQQLSYQWFRNGNILPDATTGVCFLQNLTTNDSATYQVIITNSAGAVTSAPVTVSVQPVPPQFNTQPSDVTVLAGNPVTFSAQTYGLPNYQWFFNGDAIASATSSALVLNSVVGTNAGNYWLVATNELGTATTRTALLSVIEIPPSITTQPTDKTVLSGGRTSISIVRTGAPTPTVQWFRNGAPISGATSPTYNIVGATTNDTGTYFCVVSNYLGSATSQVATITVTPPVSLSGSWFTNEWTWTSGGDIAWTVQTNVTYDGGDALQGGTLPLTTSETYVETSANGPLWVNFWWKVSSYTNANYLEFLTNDVRVTRISGEAGWSQVQCFIPNGTHRLRWKLSRSGSFSSGQEKAWVDQITTTFPSEPMFTAHPANRTVLQRGYTTLNSSAVGAAPLAYQWYFNDTLPIAGATTESLVLTNFQQDLAGNYRVLVTNNFGSALSSNATLTMAPIAESAALTPLWQRAPGSASWLPIETAHSYRSIAYNPVNGHVLVVSRASGVNIWVLDGNTGAELYPLNLGSNVISGGIYSLNMAEVADDGAVYAGNLVDDPATPYRLYRWADDSSNSVPVLVWEGDPLSGIRATRWGDTIAVRGSGSQTEILLAENNVNFVSAGYASIIKPATGLHSSPLPLSVVAGPVPGVLRARFGPGKTLFVKAPSYNLSYVDYTDTPVTTIKSYPISSTITGMDVDPTEEKLAVIMSDAPDHVRLYDIPALTNGLNWLDTEFFSLPFDTANSFLTGSMDFGGGRLYALDSNNGIMAFNVAPTLRSVRTGNTVTLMWATNHVLQAAASLNSPFVDMTNTVPPLVIDGTESPQQFYRLKH